MTPSMDPNVWGPAVWDLLFYLAFHVDLKKHCQKMQTLFHLLEVMLPCSDCRRHYAVYKKQVPLVSNVKKDDRESAAKWLWTIHDMVNQHLGKICIDYNKLVKKHKSFTCIVSDMNVMDCVIFIWLSSKNREKTCEGINILLDLLRTTGSFRVCDVTVTPLTTEEDMWRSKNMVLHAHHALSQTLDEFRAQYRHAHAEVATSDDK